MDKPIVLVTGASGFVGLHLCRALYSSGYSLRAITTSLVKKEEIRHCLEIENEISNDSQRGSYEIILVENKYSEADWGTLCEAVDIVIHLAGRAHILKETSVDPLVEFRKANRDLTQILASAASVVGVKRFVYLSSIGVIGSFSGQLPLNESNRENPHDLYAVTKLEAENELVKVANSSSLEYVIIRPPLIYGVGVKGNLLSLLRVCEKSIPLPFATLNNKRSLIAVENLIEYIILSMVNPNAHGEVFLVSDDEDLSTGDIVRAISSGMGLPSRLFSVPSFILDMLCMIPILGARLRKLTHNLQVDSTKAQKYLGWRSKVSPVEGLAKTGRWHHEMLRHKK